jgi:hypothetical protein
LEFIGRKTWYFSQKFPVSLFEPAIFNGVIPQVNIIRAFLSGGISPFEELQAAEAAHLYNAIGRVHQFRIGAMIAGSAISAGAPLATSNTQDFRRFVPYGLTLISTP